MLINRARCIRIEARFCASQKCPICRIVHSLRFLTDNVSSIRFIWCSLTERSTVPVVVLELVLERYLLLIRASIYHFVSNFRGTK